VERSRSSQPRSSARQPSRGRQTQNSLRAGLPSEASSSETRPTSNRRSHSLSVPFISQVPSQFSLNSISTSKNSENPKTAMSSVPAGQSSVPSTSTGAGNTNTPSIPAGASQAQPSSMRLRMPKPGEKNAPTFDVDKPEELGRFFDRMEDWFADDGLVNDGEKKKRIVKYLDADSEIQWKALPSFSTGTFEEFKAEAMSSYPAAEEVMKGSVAALKRKLKRLGPIASDERDDLLALIRVMTAEVMKLKKITPPIHTNRELVDLFLGRLTPDFANSVASKLSVHRLVDQTQNQNQNPRNPEDMYDIEEVMKMAKQSSLEQANPFGKFLLGAHSGQSVSSVKLEEAVAQLTDSINLQAQYNKQNDQRLSNLQSIMSQSRPIQSQGYGVNSQSSYNRGQVPGSNAISAVRSGNCYYCELEGHRIPDCGDVKRHLELGWIIKVDGFMRLPDGSKLPRDPSKSTKELIDNLHKQVPGIIKLPAKTNLYSSSSGVVSLLQSQAGGSELKEEDKIVLDLVRRIGYDKANDLLANQLQAIEEEEWEQNFE
jgi:hypothetical protein